MSETAISIRDLLFSYPQRGHRPPFALAVPELAVREGERIALHGPSGSGKSTLLQLLAGMLVPTAGLIEVGGRELQALGEAQLRAHRIGRIGFIYQDFPLVDYLSAEENVLYPYRLNRALRLDAEVVARARSLLDELGLEERGESWPRELSQGERQRVAIARALITRPRLILADEPTAGLDPPQSGAVLSLVEELAAASGATLVWVTHDPALLERFARRLDVSALRRLSQGPSADAP